MKFVWKVEFEFSADTEDDAEDLVTAVFDNIAGELRGMSLLNDRVVPG